MARRERDKGRKGEAEVLHALGDGGFTIRGLERGGDHIALGYGLVLHVESKRQETTRPWLWHEQSQRDTPEGAHGVVAFRRSRSPWLAQLELSDLLTMIRHAYLQGKAVGERGRP